MSLWVAADALAPNGTGHQQPQYSRTQRWPQYHASRDTYNKKYRVMTIN